MTAPLDGLRVVELGNSRAVAVCGMSLADLGADVVTVVDIGPSVLESAAEDDGGFDRGKRSLALDLTHPEGQQLLAALVERSDILVTHLPRADLDARGLLAGSGLVSCSLTPFGSDGPMARRPATDLTLQAASGVMSLTGHAELPPVPNAFPIADLSGGMYAACAIVAAIVDAKAHAANGGAPRPVHIAISQLHCLVQMLGYTAQKYFIDGRSPGRVGSGHHSISPYECFRAADGWLVVCAFSQSIWLRLLDAIAAPELGDDPRFADLHSRSANTAQLKAELNARLGTRPVRDWLTVLLEHDVPAAHVASLPDALASDFVHERGLVVERKLGDDSVQYGIASPIIGDGNRWVASEPDARDGAQSEAVGSDPAHR